MRASTKKTKKQQSKTGRRIKTAAICAGTGVIAAAATMAFSSGVAGAAGEMVDLPVTAQGVPQNLTVHKGDVVRVKNEVSQSAGKTVLGQLFAPSGGMTTKITGLTRDPISLNPGQERFVKYDNTGTIHYNAAYTPSNGGFFGGREFGKAEGILAVVPDSAPVEKPVPPAPPASSPTPEPKADAKPAAPAVPAGVPAAVPTGLPAVPPAPAVPGVPGVSVPPVPSGVPLAGDGESASPSPSASPSAEAALLGAGDGNSDSGIQLPESAMTKASDAVPAAARLETPLLIAVVLLSMVSAGLIRTYVLRRHAAAGSMA